MAFKKQIKILKSIQTELGEGCGVMCLRLEAFVKNDEIR